MIAGTDLLGGIHVCVVHVGLVDVADLHRFLRGGDYARDGGLVVTRRDPGVGGRDRVVGETVIGLHSGDRIHGVKIVVAGSPEQAFTLYRGGRGLAESSVGGCRLDLIIGAASDGRLAQDPDLVAFRHPVDALIFGRLFIDVVVVLILSAVFRAGSGPSLPLRGYAEHNGRTRLMRKEEGVFFHFTSRQHRGCRCKGPDGRCFHFLFHNHVLIPVGVERVVICSFHDLEEFLDFLPLDFNKIQGRYGSDKQILFQQDRFRLNHARRHIRLFVRDTHFYI